MRKAGLLRDNLDLYAPEIIRNEFGEQTTVFKKVYSCRCCIFENTGGRLIDTGEIVNSIDITFQVRLHIPVTYEMQVYYKGNKFKINFIDKRIAYGDCLIKCSKITE